MKRIIEYPAVFVSGGIIYCLIELLWRGHTHWSMAVAGGLCFILIYCIRRLCPDVSLTVRCLTGAVSICAVEFAVGFAVNIVLGWNVWDYSDRPLNICGQICPTYGILWFLLCIPGNILSEKIERLFRRPGMADMVSVSNE